MTPNLTYTMSFLNDVGISAVRMLELCPDPARFLFVMLNAFKRQLKIYRTTLFLLKRLL